MVPRRSRVHRLFGVVALAERIPLPTLRQSCRLAIEHRSLGVHRVWASDLCDGGNDLPPHAHAATDVVRGGVLMTGQKQGVSALGLQRALGLGSYQTAWAMLHRFRSAMVRPARERLGGWVEVDEAYVGGVEGAVHGRETTTKSIVAIAVEIKSPKGFGRIRLRSVPDVTQDSLIPFIEAVVERGSTVHTD